MLLYLVSLFIGIFGVIAIYYAFSRSLDRNSSRRNKRPVSYLAPVFLSIGLVLFTINYTAPRLQDLVSLLSDKLYVQEVRLETQQIGWLTLDIGSSTYYYNRFQVKPLPAVAYRLTALPHSRHVLSLEPIGEDTRTGGLK